jgi:hypothetical protein
VLDADKQQQKLQQVSATPLPEDDYEDEEEEEEQ